MCSSEDTAKKSLLEGAKLDITYPKTDVIDLDTLAKQGISEP
jgi:hypothetical protein